MRVLVTGSTSLIGSHVVEILRRRGDTVTTLQRRSGAGAGRTSGEREVLTDITDRRGVAAAMVAQDAVVHLAARVGVIGSWGAFEHTNVVGTRVVIDAAHEAGVSRFVHVSSPSVAHQGRSLVGAGAGAARPESTRGHYATSKALAERAALASSTAGFAVVAIRPHLVWGPGDTQLIGRIVERARAGRLAVIGSGAALVDTTVVDNAADALVAALDHAPAIAGSALVVSNGEPRPIAEILESVVMAAGLRSPRVRVPTRLAYVGGLIAERHWERTGREDDPPMTSFLAEQLSTAHWFDQRLTREALGWTPAVTLDEGFQRLAAWFDAEQRRGGSRQRN